MGRFHQFLNLGLAVAVFLTGTGVVTEACSCLPRHPQRKFCQATYVIKGRVVSKEIPLGTSSSQSDYWDYSDYDNRPQITYTVYVQRVYKGDDIPRREQIQIVTNTVEDSCGLPGLQEGHIYVLMGTGGSGALEIGYCDYHQEWSGLSMVHKQGLKNHWKKYCGDCEPVSEYDYSEVNTEGTCSYPAGLYTDYGYADYGYGSYGYSSCEDQFARCRRNFRGDCVWSGGQEYKDCVEY